MSLVPGKVQGHLGRYELLARLASGGMGEIFLGRLSGAAGFEKLYVIKRVLPHLADDARFRAMLVDEARIAAKMSHPNICQVYELGEADGQLFIVMEYLEGVTLLPVLRRAAKARQPLAVGLVAAVMQQTADALHYAHDLAERDGTRLNVVHRDVTPGNLFLTETGIVKVLDFGIAKAKDASAQTQDGTVKGKYAYMAPEQLRSEEVDRRVDVFSLAIVGFEMLALRRLFQRKTDYLTFRAVMELPIPDLREFRPDLPAGVAEAFRRALERDPGNRFPTVRQFGAALHDAISGHAKVWSSSDLGDYITANFAEDLRRRGTAVNTVIADTDTSVGRTTMPVVSLDPAPPDDDQDDFPSIDTGAGVHELDKLSRRDTATPVTPGPIRVGTGSDPGGSLTELAPAPRDRTAPHHAMAGTGPVPAHPGRRSVLWPLFAVAIVAIGAVVLWFMWKQIKSQQNTGGIVIVDRGGVKTESGSGSGSVATPGSGTGTGTGSGSGTDAGTGSAMIATPGSGSGKPDRLDRPDKIPTTEREITVQIKRKLGAHLDAINDCVGRHTDSSKDKPTELVLVVKASGSATARVEPASVNASALGACIRKVAESIDYGRIATNSTVHQALQPR